MSSRWTEDDVQRILMNPFSSLTVVSELTEDHEPSMSTEEWIEVNERLIEEVGAQAWMKQMVTVLQEGKGENGSPINPYNAIVIDPLFAAEHEYIVPTQQWIEVNAKLLSELGAERWLHLFLDILEGDILTASIPGLGSPPDTPYGYKPEGYQSRRYHSSFPQGGKRKGKKKRK